jgi:short-subunit dehydrogenase
VQPQIEYYLYGAMTAADVILPDLLAAGAGTLLFTTGAGSLYPVAQYGNVTAGGAALRNWALNLGQALSGSGVHVAHVAIALMIADQAPAPGVDFLPADDIAPLYWDVHHTRAVHELIVKK